MIACWLASLRHTVARAESAWQPAYPPSMMPTEGQRVTKPDVLFIEPGYIPDSLIERIATSTMPPLGLLQVAAMLELDGYPVHALDFSVMPMDGRLQRAVHKYDPRFIGFSCTAPCLPIVRSQKVQWWGQPRWKNTDVDLGLCRYPGASRYRSIGNRCRAG